MCAPGRSRGAGGGEHRAGEEGACGWGAPDDLRGAHKWAVGPAASAPSRALCGADGHCFPRARSERKSASPAERGPGAANSRNQATGRAPRGAHAHSAAAASARAVSSRPTPRRRGQRQNGRNAPAPGRHSGSRLSLVAVVGGCTCWRRSCRADSPFGSDWRIPTLLTRREAAARRSRRNRGDVPGRPPSALRGRWAQGGEEAGPRGRDAVVVGRQGMRR